MGLFSRRKPLKHPLTTPQTPLQTSPEPFKPPSSSSAYRSSTPSFSPLPSPTFPVSASTPSYTSSPASSLPIPVSPSYNHHHPQPFSRPQTPQSIAPSSPVLPRPDLSFCLPPLSLSPPALSPIDLRRQSQIQIGNTHLDPRHPSDATSEFGALFDNTTPYGTFPGRNIGVDDDDDAPLGSRLPMLQTAKNGSCLVSTVEDGVPR